MNVIFVVSALPFLSHNHIRCPTALVYEYSQLCNKTGPATWTLLLFHLISIPSSLFQPFFFLLLFLLLLLLLFLPYHSSTFFLPSVILSPNTFYKYISKARHSHAGHFSVFVTFIACSQFFPHLISTRNPLNLSNRVSNSEQIHSVELHTALELFTTGTKIPHLQTTYPFQLQLSLKFKRRDTI